MAISILKISKFRHEPCTNQTDHLQLNVINFYISIEILNDPMIGYFCTIEISK